MKRTRIVSEKRVHGEVECNDGEFAEIQTVGIEGVEKNLLLETVQAHRDDTSYSCEQFQDKLSVGTWLDICTTSTMTQQRTVGAVEGGSRNSIIRSMFNSRAGVFTE
jgi:hypothetical protein